MSKTYIYFHIAFAFSFLLFLSGCSPNLSHRIADNLFVIDSSDLCKIHERSMIIAVEAHTSRENTFSTWYNGTDTFWINYAVEVDSTCWNLKKSYSNGLYSYVGKAGSMGVGKIAAALDQKNCDAAIALQNHTRLQYYRISDFFHTVDTSNITILQDPNFMEMYYHNVYDISTAPEFIGHQYRICKANIKYIFKGIQAASVVNFFPDVSDSEGRIVIQVPYYQILEISDVVPIEVNTKDCMK